MPPTDLFGADLGRLRNLGSAKWTRYPEDVIPAWVADMDLMPAPMALDAMRAVIDVGDIGYNLRAELQLPEAFSRWQFESHGWRPDPDDVWMFNDVLHAIEFVIWHRTEPGDGIVLLTPIYPPFIDAVNASGRRIIDCPLDPDGWRFDPARLEAVIDDTTKIVLWCNPHNPTGRAFDVEELTALGAVADAHDLVVISDEVWGDLVHPGATHVPAALVSGLAERTVTVSSASKSFNLAGLRCAVAHTGDESVRAMLRVLPPRLRGHVNTLGAEASLACWQEGRDWLDGVRRHLTNQRDHLATRIEHELPTVRFGVPDATYLAWLDFRSCGLGPVPSKLLLDDGRIALSAGTDFGIHGEGFARLNTATSRALLDEIVDRVIQTIPSDPE